MNRTKILFFVKKFLPYIFFFLWPHFILKNYDNNFLTLLVSFFPYSIFLKWQWVLFGKEAEHRLKIYTRSNSAMDRLLERLILGSVIGVLVSSFFSFFDFKVQEFLFYCFWVSWGLWISWPTRKKIFEQKVNTDFGEFKFLDGFEKTVLLIFLIIFFISIPFIPRFQGEDAIKLFLDPSDNIHFQIFGFLKFHSLPLKIPQLKTNIFIVLEFYSYFFVLFFLGVYSFCRFHLSRRLSILSLFAIITSWSFSLIMKNHFSHIPETIFSVCWVWSILWSLKSYSYRSGFIIGFLNYLMVLVNPSFIFLIPFQFFLIGYFLRKIKNSWYRNQFFKYTILGNLLAVFSFFTHNDPSFSFDLVNTEVYFLEIINILNKKSLYVISFLGLLTMLLGSIFPNKYKNKIRSEETLITLGAWSVFFIVSAFFVPIAITGYTLVFILVFLAIAPLDILFEKLSLLRSKRNLIFMIYVIICLLDSHLEGRIKLMYENFL